MRTRPAALFLASAMLLAACTAAREPTVPSSGSSSASPSAASPSPSATPDVVVRGADARLAALVQKVYSGKSGVTATATMGTWKSEKVAVVTAGDDVTLAVGPNWKVVGGWWPSLGKGPDLGKGPRFLLVVGSDARPDEPLKGSRGDTLQVLGIDGKGGGGVMGIPRDTWVPMPGGGSAKINAAFSYGGGAGQLASVRKLTGLPVEGYVATGFKGFKAIVNQSGGLQMEIAKKIVFLHSLTIPSGKQSLSGKEALAYARERKSLANGDFGRSAHQGDMLLAAAIAARLSGRGRHREGDDGGVAQRRHRPQRRGRAHLRRLVLPAQPAQGGARRGGGLDRHQFRRPVDREGQLVGASGVRPVPRRPALRVRACRARDGVGLGAGEWRMASASIRVDSGAVRAGSGRACWRGAIGSAPVL